MEYRIEYLDHARRMASTYRVYGGSVERYLDACAAQESRRWGGLPHSWQIVSAGGRRDARGRNLDYAEIHPTTEGGRRAYEEGWRQLAEFWRISRAATDQDWVNWATGRGPTSLRKPSGMHTTEVA